MIRVDVNKHCSLNKTVRNLFYQKQEINNSIYYSDEEKKKLTIEIEKKIYNKWMEVKSNIGSVNL